MSDLKNFSLVHEVTVVSGQQMTTWVLAWKGILETWKRRGARLREIRTEPSQGSAQGSILLFRHAVVKEGKGAGFLPNNPGIRLQVNM